MGIAYNTSIVRDGLVLHLDAANVKSYPGSGTVWKDLSGNSNNGTLVNGVSYIENNRGTFVFDGSDDRVSFTSTLRSVVGGIAPVYTLSAWVYRTSTTTEWDILLGGLGFNTGLVMAAGQKFKFTNWHNGTGTKTAAQSIGTTVSELNQWYNLVGIFDFSSTMSLYVNGIKEAETSISSFSSWDNYSILIGGTPSGSSTYGTFPGWISSAFIYNRALSASEIRQNFEATRRRYGI